MSFPFSVPAPSMRGLPADVATGAEEEQLCCRLDGLGKTCLGKIEYLPDATFGGCSCPTGHPPCSYCTSTMPECRRCGWREDY